MPTTEALHRSIRKRDIDRVKGLLRSGEGGRALRMLGDRWSFLILRDAFLGVRRFEDLRRLTGATRGTLAARLRSLVDNGVLYRCPCDDAPKRYEYRLTEKGMDLYPVALTLWAWEARWGNTSGLPPRLVHEPCGKTLQPIQVCGDCSKPVDPHEVRSEAGPGRRYYGTAQRATRRRDPVAKKPADGVDQSLFHVIDTIADRWSGQLLVTLFFGLHRYDDINAAVGIATNILSDRLRRFLAAGVVEQHLYRSRPLRYEYRLTPKGLDLYHFTVAMHDWATRWNPAPQGPAIILLHRLCGQILKSKMVCAHCLQTLKPREVTVSGSRRWTAARRAPQTRKTRAKA
jgi:DNA-binding HxlR family transcriptional regulator